MKHKKANLGRKASVGDLIHVGEIEAAFRLAMATAKRKGLAVTDYGPINLANVGRFRMMLRAATDYLAEVDGRGW